MKTLAKIIMPIILLILNGCAHHSGYYSAYSGNSNYEYDIGISSHDLHPSYPVYYDRHIYLNPPIVHEYHPYGSDHVYPDRHYHGHNKHQKPHVDKHFSNQKYINKIENHSANNHYQKHQKPKVNNYFSNNKHPIKGGSHAINNYSTQRNQLKHQKQTVKNYAPNNKHSNKARNYTNKNYSIHKNQQRHKKQIVNNYTQNNKYSNKAKNHPNRQYTTNNQSFSSGARYNKHSRGLSSRKMISGKNFKR